MYASCIGPGHMAALGSQGFCVVPDFLAPSNVERLAADVLALDKAGVSREASVGNPQQGTLQLARETRRSRMTPLYPPPLPSAGSIETRMELYRTIERLRSTLDSAPLGLPPLQRFDTELAYLSYPTGGFYKKHVDVPLTPAGRPHWSHVGRTDADGGGSGLRRRRSISLLLYLNTGWGAADGGELRIFDREEGYLDVPPEGGTLVLFKSDEIEHEVLPTRRPRQCVVGWFRSLRHPGPGAS